MINILGFQLNGWFLAAGAACACVPLIIHLLNRRRFRTVNWAAMDFLRQALQRNRRILQIRDLLLLALRTLAVLLFALALAQPLWEKRTDEKFDPNDRKPLHAVMIVDNSLSMGYEVASGENLLSRAQQRADAFIKELPAGSRVTVVPLCGSPNSYTLDPYRTADDATSAVDQIEVVDRTTNVDQAADIARRASEIEPNLAKRVVFLSDQQQSNWEARLNAAGLKQYPEMQIVDVSADEPENSWISEFRMDDDIADIETPAHFTVRVRHTGATRREDVQLSLWVNGQEVAPRRISLEPGSAEQEFVFETIFADNDIDVKPGETVFVPVEIRLSADEHDRLLGDNQRFLVAPVVAALPVVFVDELGEQGENRALSRFGETYQLRRWLVPVVDRNDTSRQLVRIVHVSINELSEDLLADARLVVVAGVADPTTKVELLREYVQQGGQMLIAAGGDFDPRAWNTAAWLDGSGILPAPLEPDLIGQIPGSQGAEFEWFELAYDSTLRSHGLFKLTEESDEDLAALYSQPFFFQAVAVTNVEENMPEFLEREATRLKEQYTQQADATARKQRLNDLGNSGDLTEGQRAERAADQELLRQFEPSWLKWATTDDDSEDKDLAALANDPAALADYAAGKARDQRPQVLARFDNGNAYLVERRIGDGRVVFASSGIKPEWNTLAQTNAMLLFDRLLRGMLNATMPRRNLITAESITLPVEGNTSGLQFELQRPTGASETSEPEPISVGFIGSQTRGFTITNALHQGIYKITAYGPPASADSQSSREQKWQTAIALNVTEAGEGGESDLQPLTRDEFEKRLEGEEVPVSWVGANDSISLAGSTVRGQNWWKILAVVVLLLLLLEIAILAWPVLTASRTPENAETP